MKIIYIGDALSGHGLTPTTADTLPGLLRDSGHRVTVASSRLNVVLRMGDMLATILLHRFRADLAIIDVYSTRNFWYAYLCALLCRFLGLPYIPFMHGGDFPERMARSPRMVATLLRGARKTVVPSGFLQAALAEKGYLSEIIPNVIPIDNYPYKPRNRVAPRLLYVRSLAGLYNPVMALQVLARLSIRHPDAVLCMVGPDKDGRLAECIRVANELGVRDRVRFTGKLEKPEWHALSAQYDIFINTTNKDNMPVSVIEAMALGLPVVSTRAGGMPFLVEDGVDGLLVDIGDFEGMARAVERLVDSPATASRLGMNARSKALSFSWREVYPKWRKIYEGVTGT